MDWIPVASQLKSLVQVTFGDAEGARRTQMNFVRQCPIVSQSYAFGVAITGDTKEAERSQKEFLSTMGSIVDSLPGVGHIKGAVHYAVGDKEGGDNAMKAASRSAAQVGAGIGGFVLGGPVVAALAASGAGYAMDGITTGVDSAIHEEYRPSGMIAAVTSACKDPTDPGKWFDVVAPVAIDAASIALAIKAQPKWELQQQIGKDGAKYAIKLSDEMKAMHKSGKIPAGTKHMMSAAIDSETGAFAVGHNQNVRQMLNEPLSRIEAVRPRRPKPNFSCAEYQLAIQRARDAGLNPGTVIKIKKVKGGMAPAFTSKKFSHVTYHKGFERAH